MDDLDAVLAEVRGMLSQVVGLSDADTGPQRVAKQKLIVYLGDHCGLLPRSGLASMVNKSQQWVTYVIGVMEGQAAKHAGYRAYLEKLAAAVKAGLPEPSAAPPHPRTAAPPEQVARSGKTRLRGS